MTPHGQWCSLPCCIRNRLHENILQVVGHYVWRRWGSSSDISDFRQSFYTENDWRTWFSRRSFSRQTLCHFTTAGHSVWRSRGLSSDIFKTRQTCLTDFGKPESFVKDTSDIYQGFKIIGSFTGRPNISLYFDGYLSMCKSNIFYIFRTLFPDPFHNDPHKKTTGK